MMKYISTEVEELEEQERRAYQWLLFMDVK